MIIPGIFRGISLVIYIRNNGSRPWLRRDGFFLRKIGYEIGAVAHIGLFRMNQCVRAMLITG